MANHEININAGDNGGHRSDEGAYMSLILGLALLVMVPMMLNFNVALWSEGPEAGPTYIPMNLAYPAGIVGVILPLVIALTSIVLGVRGILIAIKQGRSKVLPLTGTLVSVVAFIQWSIVAIDLIAILSCFRFIKY